MPLLNEAADACPGDNSYERQTVTSAEVCAIPSDMVGKFCRFSAETSDVWIRFGTSDAVTVDATQVSARDNDTKELTPHAATAHLHIVAGTSEQFRLQGDWTHLAHISADTSGLLRFAVWQGAKGSD